MREIKFRGRRVDNGEWVYGDFANIAVPSLGLAIRTGADDDFAEDTTPCIITTKARQHPYFSNAEPYCVVENEIHVIDEGTLGQFTGLTDKNGTEIYEGDVLRNIKTGEIRTVSWHGTMAGYVWSKPRENSAHLFSWGELFRVYRHYEVTATIHANKKSPRLSAAD